MIVPAPADALSRIAAVEGSVRVVDARGWFDVEFRETWPPWAVQRYVSERAGPASSREERDRLLSTAEIVRLVVMARTLACDNRAPS